MTQVTIIYEGEVKESIPSFRLDDFGEQLDFHFVEEDGDAFDLTGMTVEFKAKRLNDLDEFLFTETLTITDETAGEANVVFADGNMSEKGSFDGLLVISDADVIQKTIPLGYLNIY